MTSDKVLLVLDLDGTITKSDNLIRFTRFMIKERKIFRFLMFYPIYLLLVVRIISNIQFKEYYVKYILKGMCEQYVKNAVQEYIITPQFNEDLNKAVLDYLNKADNSEKVIVSANFDFLVSPIADILHIPNYKSISLDIESGRFTGNIAGIIPYDARKIESFQTIESNYPGYYTIGIGDSKSDLPLLKYLNEGYLLKRRFGEFTFYRVPKIE